MNLDEVGWSFFFSPLSSDKVKEPFQLLFFCFNRRAYGTAVRIFIGRVTFLESRASKSIRLGNMISDEVECEIEGGLSV